MEPMESFKDRIAFTLKSGLLCAAMLMPVVTLAHSQEESDADTSVMSSSSASENPAADSMVENPAYRQKTESLSRHIQRKYNVPASKADRIVAEAIRNGERHQMEPELILAIIAVESTFKERAVSRVGARGLMQVLPGSHARKMREIGGSHQLFDPVKNIHTGSRILVSYLNAHSGDLRRALLSYNGSLHLRRSSFPDKVMRIYRDFRSVTVEG